LNRKGRHAWGRRSISPGLRAASLLGLLADDALEERDELVADEGCVRLLEGEVADLRGDAAPRGDVADGDLDPLALVVG